MLRVLLGLHPRQDRGSRECGLMVGGAVWFDGQVANFSRSEYGISGMRGASRPVDLEEQKGSEHES